MIVGVGTDLVQIERIHRVLERQPQRFIERVLTPHEREVCASKSNQAAYLAKRFAAKEAASKALGTGIGRVSWQDFEVRNNSAGAPELHLSGAAAIRLSELGGQQVWLTMSDERDYVTAFVVLEG